MTEKRYEKRMNFNINLPYNRRFKNEEGIVDTKVDRYEALSIDDIVYRLNEIDELDKENQELDEKVCMLTMDLIKTKSYEQLEKELNRFKNENGNLKSKNRGLQSELQIFKEDVKYSNLQINKLSDENEQLKYQIALLTDELEQCKAVIDKKWSEYLKKKELRE